MGCRPEDAIFLREDIQTSARDLLVQENVVLIDSLTRKEFGPKNGSRFGDEDIGVETEVMHLLREDVLVGTLPLHDLGRGEKGSERQRDG